MDKIFENPPPSPSLSISKPPHSIGFWHTLCVCCMLLEGGGRGGGGYRVGVDFQECVWSLVAQLVEKKHGHFFTEKEQISADSEQLGKSLWICHYPFNGMAPGNNHVSAISSEIFKYVRIHPNFASWPVWCEVFLCCFPLKPLSWQTGTKVFPPPPPPPPPSLPGPEWC